MDQSPQLGRVVFSTAGRDAGRFYLIVEIVDSVFVKIADGDQRRIDSPKLKKIKHLRFQHEVFDKIGDKLAEGKKVFDAEIKRALRNYNGSI